MEGIDRVDGRVGGGTRVGSRVSDVTAVDRAGWESRVGEVAVSRTDRVTVAVCRCVEGLERRVVVLLSDRRDVRPDADPHHWLLAMTRCTTQLVIVSPPDDSHTHTHRPHHPHHSHHPHCPHHPHHSHNPHCPHHPHHSHHPHHPAHTTHTTQHTHQHPHHPTPTNTHTTQHTHQHPHHPTHPPTPTPPNTHTPTPTPPNAHTNTHTIQRTHQPGAPGGGVAVRQEGRQA